jgi:GTP-binding protein
LIKVAIIGKPNVGKSSLFNRIAKERDAITSDVAGTTRDVKKREVLIDEHKILLIDTGGFDTSSELFSTVTNKAIETALEADIILYMVDGRSGTEDEDKKRFLKLKQTNPNIALVVNKIDNDKLEEDIWDFFSFGIQEIFPVSISHNRKVKQLLNWIVEKITQINGIENSENQSQNILEDNFDEVSADINIAIIGRVNVGKSSLLNSITKSDRSIVSSVAGTTIDPIDEVVEIQGKKIKFVDTAGIRRRGKIEGIEKYALMRTEKMLERSDIAILVLDASEDLKELDEKIAGLVDKFKLATIIVLNKWDKALYDYSSTIKIVREKFKFLYFAPIVTISALTHKRVHKITDLIFKVFENYTKRISTAQINQVIEKSVIKHSLPAPKGRILKIYYATQFDIAPPKIILIMNRPKLLHFTYKRYLVNQLRAEFVFEGSPLIIETKDKNSRNSNKS